MTTESKIQIEHWAQRLARMQAAGKGAAAKQRLTAYACGLCLGREFGETSDDYFARRGLTEFVAWAREQTK